MKVPILGRVIDERFFEHRTRSTSIGGMCGVALAGILLFYRHFVDHVWSWDLFAVIAVMAIAKIAAMTWYYVTD